MYTPVSVETQPRSKIRYFFGWGKRARITGTIRGRGAARENGVFSIWGIVCHVVQGG